jgi:SAM-dependent methyltransferase
MSASNAGIDMNPQVRQMADESMVRNLAAQALAIWPQEAPLFDRYGLPAAARILDVGCGTGEISSRLAERFPSAEVLGMDILQPHIELARQRYASLAPRLRFEQGDAFRLPLPDGSFDLAVCRHMLQAVPFPERVMAELVRVTRPGGKLHLLLEDYGMIFTYPTRLDLEAFWREAITRFGGANHIDLSIGRRGWTLCREQGLLDVRVDYVAVDTVRVPRETFAAIIEAWRDGYAEAIAEHTRYTVQEVVEHLEDVVASIRHPHGYALWNIPIVSATVPG